jgi:hypothetical protein
VLRGGPGVALALTEDFRSFERYGVTMQPANGTSIAIYSFVQIYFSQFVLLSSNWFYRVPPYLGSPVGEICVSG